MMYKKRDLCELEPHYTRHVMAMTGEGLHSKSDIAAELAVRDAKIEFLLTISGYEGSLPEFEDLRDAKAALKTIQEAVPSFLSKVAK